MRDAGIGVRDVAELTGWPEMLGGRVKTLHPKVHGGILFRRGRAEDLEQTRAQGIAPIDLVVVNLYPFEATAARPNLTSEELIENIDIGGPAMVRSAAKNFESVAVVTNPADYPALAKELKATGNWSLATRLALARKAFAATARYDGKIATELERLVISDGTVTVGERPLLPERVHIALSRTAALRYGENPHQKAALYIPAGGEAWGLAGAKQLQGKELSYNNLVDLDAAWGLTQEFAQPAAVIVKHNNPCGTAENPVLAEAYRQALACDPVSAFGGVLAFNRPLDAATATEVAKLFAECIVAPGYDAAAREALTGKKNLRLLEIGGDEPGSETSLELKRISGGVLVQERDARALTDADLKVASKRQPTPEEMDGDAFCMEGGQARQVECHCFCARRPHRGRGRGADEPRGFGQDRGDEGAGTAGGHGSRVGCVFSVPRRR